MTVLESSALPIYSAIYAFGDSLSDAGNLSITTSTVNMPFPISPPYFTEQYGSTRVAVFSNGPTWVQNLSIALGFGTLKPSLAGGTDFAYGGAETGSTPQVPNNANTLQAQLTQFQLNVPKPSANALYTLSIGINDLNDILAVNGLSAAQQTADVTSAVTNEINFIKQLVADGATNLLVLDIPDLGKTPNVIAGRVNGSTGSAALTAEASQLASQYNTELINQLGTIAGLDAHVIDAYALIDNAVADPSAYGLTNVSSPVWSGNYTSASSGILATTSIAAQNQYLFLDQLHPTETGHQAIADTGEQLLSGVPPLTIADITTGQPVTVNGQPYVGPVSGLQQQYINITTDNLNIAATTPNWFIRSGSGEDAVAVTSGTNVLDGGSGSNFLTGGSGTDTFFDNASTTETTWSTISNFHIGDAVTLFGITPSDFTLSWANDEGATGYTGLTLTATAHGQPNTLLTLAGFNNTALTNGTLSISSGTESSSGVAYTYIHDNG